MDSHKRTLTAYGYLLRFARAKADISPATVSGFNRAPRSCMSDLMGQLMMSGSIDADADAELGAIIDCIDPDDTCGTNEEPLNPTDVGIMQMAYWRYHAPADNDMTPLQAAQALGISHQAVYKALNSGKLRGIKRADGWRIFGDSVSARLKSRA